MNVIPFFIYIITTYIIYLYIRRFYCLSVFIWIMHTVSMFCFWLKADFLSSFENDYTWSALLIMYFTLVLITIPLIQYEKKTVNLNQIKVVDGKKILMLSRVLIVLSLYSLVFFAINLPKVFALEVNDVRYNRITFYTSSIFSKTAVLGAFSSVYCIYFFYYLNAINKNKIIRILLLLSSTSFIIYTLNVAGRDGIVIWGLSIFAGLFAFYKYLDKKTIKQIKLLIVIGAIITIPILSYITSSRFSDSRDKNAEIDSVLSYTGQALPNLSYAIDLTKTMHRRSGEGVFPIALVRSLTGNEEDRFERMEASMVYGFRSNQFSSYVGFFYPTYPLYVLIIFIIIYIIIIRSSVKGIYNQFNIATFIPAYTWAMIPIVGIFYFYYGELAGNVFLLLPFLIRFYLKK